MMQKREAARNIDTVQVDRFYQPFGALLVRFVLLFSSELLLFSRIRLTQFFEKTINQFDMTSPSHFKQMIGQLEIISNQTRHHRVMQLPLIPLVQINIQTLRHLLQIILRHRQVPINNCQLHRRLVVLRLIGHAEVHF